MNIVAFILVLAAGALGLADSYLRRTLSGLAVALLASGVVLDLCFHVSHTVHS